MEIEFQIAYNMGIPFDFDQKEFYQFMWIYERLCKERQKENEKALKQQGRFSLNSGGF
jgi:hypothetical protein